MIRYLTDLSVDAFVEAARNIPYQQVHSDLFPGIDLWIRRDDLIDPLISGNKAYKLLFNLLEARDQGKDTIITCGGAWSNHIHATAAAGQRFGFKTIGIIRGERSPVLSAMLQDAERFGMELRFVSRALYRERHSQDFLQRVGLGGQNAWFVPEGGANLQGAKGVQLLSTVIGETIPVAFDECWVPCGTGLTLGALSIELPNNIKLVGVPVLKAGQSIRATATEWASYRDNPRQFDLISAAHFGGYGKTTNLLIALQSQIESLGGVSLDHVYTAKLAVTLMLRCPSDGAKSGAMLRRVLLLHTGGLQGRRGLVKN